MIILWMLICFAVLLTSSVVWGYVSHNVWASRYYIVIFATWFIILSVFSVGTRITAQDTVDNIREDYETLTLYYETVNHTTNEHIRFDYYKNVSAFNERYSNCVACYNSAWIGALYPNDGLKGISPIEFNLVGDEYLLEGIPND